jgi:hypothetical protein
MAWNPGGQSERALDEKNNRSQHEKASCHHPCGLVLCRSQNDCQVMHISLAPKALRAILPANEAPLYHLTKRKATAKWHWQTLLPRLCAKFSRSALLNTLVNGPHFVFSQAAIIGLKR